MTETSASSSFPLLGLSIFITILLAIANAIGWIHVSFWIIILPILLALGITIVMVIVFLVIALVVFLVAHVASKPKTYRRIK